jgi:putative protease
MLRPGAPVRVGVEDEAGNVATAAGPVPEKARIHELTAEEVSEQLSKTGGTPYRRAKVRALVEPGLSLPLSALNALRREVLEDLSARRVAPPVRRHEEFHPGVRYENRKDEPVLTIALRRMEQLTPELLALAPALVYLPPEEIVAQPEKAADAISKGVPVAVTLPRIAWDGELPGLREELEAIRKLGVTDVLAGNLGLIETARELGYNLRGDFGLGAFNSQAMKELKRMGFSSATASFELRLSQVRDLSKCIDTELIVYGRLPLMIMENCIIKNRTGLCACENVNQLTDRTSVRFPVVKARGCRNELLNAKKLFLADKQKEYQKIGLWGARLSFTTENPRECVQVTERYLGRGSYEPNDYTRGLYYREVE